MPRIPALSDETVAAFAARIVVDHPFLTLADESAAEAVPDPIQALLAIHTWLDAAEIADAAASGEGTSTDNQSFRFGADGRVVIAHPIGDAVSVSRPAFVGLLLRLLDTLVDAAVARDDPVVGSQLWTTLLESRDRLRAERP